MKSLPSRGRDIREGVNSARISRAIPPRFGATGIEHIEIARENTIEHARAVNAPENIPSGAAIAAVLGRLSDVAAICQ